MEININPSSHIIIQTGEMKGYYEITDLSGKKICSGLVKESETTLSTENWANGSYFIRVLGEGLEPVVKRITIK